MRRKVKLISTGYCTLFQRPSGNRILVMRVLATINVAVECMALIDQILPFFSYQRNVTNIRIL